MLHSGRHSCSRSRNGSLPERWLKPDSFENFAHRYAAMSCDTFKDALKRPYFYWAMIWNDFMVLAADLGRDSQMRARLSSYDVTQCMQRAGKFGAGEVAR